MKPTRDLIFLKLETTGLKIAKDRICKISFVKYETTGKKEILQKERLVNPEINIPEEATAIHGITNKMVEEEATFKQVSKSFFKLFDNSDILGFNIQKFDIPILIEEFLRSDLELSMKNRNIIDLYSILHKTEPRDFKSVYKYYTGKELTDYRNDLKYLEASAEIFKKQIEKNKDLAFTNKENEIIENPFSSFELLHEFINKENDEKKVDYAGLLQYNEEGQIVFSYGKNKGKTVTDINENDVSFIVWFLNNPDYPMQTKNIIKKIIG